MLISEYVRSCRKRLGLTQKQLASLAGISLSALQRIEAQITTKNARGRTIFRLCKAMQGDIDFMIMECKWGRNGL